MFANTRRLAVQIGAPLLAAALLMGLIMLFGDRIPDATANTPEAVEEQQEEEMVQPQDCAAPEEGGGGPEEGEGSPQHDL